MRTSTILIIVLASVAGVIVVTACIRVIWRLVGVYLIQRAGPRKLRATKQVLWRDPGRVEDRDLAAGPGGADGKPVPPFTFSEENQSGSNPCVSVRDAKDRVWRVKWGEEVQSETFAVRLAWAVGYFAEVTHYVAEGTIAGARDLQRASSCLDEQGRFSDARFELEDARPRTHWEEHSWAWNDNPFVGTPQLNGLKILVMLLSNWDSKDQRDVARGSNTGIFEYTVPGRGREARYLITDWGGSMGRWGTLPATRANWDPDAFEAQTPRFITGVTQDGIVEFGYTGQRTTDVSAGIRVEDVRWVHGYLGRITDRQIMDALHASGASPEEAERYTAALRERIGQLGEVAQAAP